MRPTVDPLITSRRDGIERKNCCVCREPIPHHVVPWSRVSPTGDMKVWHPTCPEPKVGRVC